MSIVKLDERWKVNIIESERGWGRKVEDTIYFDNKEEAYKYVIDFNEEHLDPSGDTPDWYMIAEGPHPVR